MWTQWSHFLSRRYYRKLLIEVKGLTSVAGIDTQVSKQSCRTLIIKLTAATALPAYRNWLNNDLCATDYALLKRVICFHLFLKHTHRDPLSCRQSSLLFGIPQGSILCPVLFITYMLVGVLSSIQFRVIYLSFFDDAQLFVPKKSGTTDGSFMMSCLAELKNWVPIISYQRSKRGNLSFIFDTWAYIFNLNISFDGQITKCVQSHIVGCRHLNKIR